EALVLRKVEIASGGDAFEFLRAKGELEQQVDGGPGVMGQFFGLLPVFFERFAGKANALVIRNAFFDPVLMPHLPAPIGLRLAGMPGARGFGDAAANGLDSLVRFNEKFEFHLLELAGAKSEVARIDLVAEGFPHLRYAERQLLPGSYEDI